MVKLISVTPDAEKIMAYCARVSNPSNQDNPDYSKLLAYCIKNAHWSVFEMAHLTIEIITSRAISGQILRHKSFSFQEHSQRYSEVSGYVQYEARRQDDKNRQNSIDDLPEDVKIWFKNAQDDVYNAGEVMYKRALKQGIAKECARMLLPLNTQTRLYMSGNIRSWVNYINVRTDSSTQLEHREIALACKEILCNNLPIIAKALEWRE